MELEVKGEELEPFRGPCTLFIQAPHSFFGEGAEVHRNGTPDNPAFVIVQDNGDKVIKLQSEVTAGER